MPAEVRREWFGREIEARFRRAVGRGTIGLGEGVSYHAKNIVHVWNGDLKRSIHVAQAYQLGGGQVTWITVQTREGAIVEVGSWLDYACVEETGRGHRYMQPALELVARTALRTMKEAFRQEGLDDLRKG